MTNNPGLPSPKDESRNESFPPAQPQRGNGSTQEDFPPLSGSPSPTSLRRLSSATNTEASRSRGQSNSSTFQGRFRSVSKTFQESNPPTGMWIATSQIASSIPSLTDIRRGSYSSDGWSGEGQVREKERRASLSRRGSSQTGEDLPRRRSSANPNVPKGMSSGEENVPETVQEGGLQVLPVIPQGVATPGMVDKSVMPTTDAKEFGKGTESNIDQQSSAHTNTSEATTATKPEPYYRTTPFDNGYQFPPKHSWKESTAIGLKATWKFFITPIGFFVIIYGCNVVAFGGMLFLLLCNASKAMCRPTCNDINSPRRKWIEVDSQILNALFCVTGFGLIPWRFRDLYYLLQYRVQKSELGLRRLAAINRGWFRLDGSQDLPAELGPGDIEVEASKFPESRLPFPLVKIPNAPLTGTRAPPTPLWKLDFVIWAMVWNTFLQAVLSGFMWGFSRYTRPTWSTGLFVALACLVAAAGGIMAFVEGKKVKGIEGVPVSDEDQARLKRDKELGITHYNNIKDEPPKEKKVHEDKGFFARKHKEVKTAPEIKGEGSAEDAEHIVR